MASLTDYPDDWEDTFLSNPNYSVVEYMSKMSEYQRLLKEKQDADDTSGMSGGSEGAGALEAGVAINRDTGKPIGQPDYGGGPLWDAAGNPQERTKFGPNVIAGGNRDWGRAFVGALPNLTNTGMFGVVNAVNKQLNKNKNQTVATSTDDTGTTNTDVIPQLLSQLSAEDLNLNNMTGSMPNNISLLSPYNYGTNAVATPISAGNGGGLLDAVTLEAINRAYDESTGGSSGGWTVG